MNSLPLTSVGDINQHLLRATCWLHMRQDLLLPSRTSGFGGNKRDFPFGPWRRWGSDTDSRAGEAWGRQRELCEVRGWGAVRIPAVPDSPPAEPGITCPVATSWLPAQVWRHVPNWDPPRPHRATPPICSLPPCPNKVLSTCDG